MRIVDFLLRSFPPHPPFCLFLFFRLRLKMDGRKFSVPFFPPIKTEMMENPPLCWNQVRPSPPLQNPSPTGPPLFLGPKRAGIVGPPPLPSTFFFPPQAEAPGLFFPPLPSEVSSTGTHSVFPPPPSFYLSCLRWVRRGYRIVFFSLFKSMGYVKKEVTSTPPYPPSID